MNSNKYINKDKILDKVVTPLQTLSILIAITILTFICVVFELFVDNNIAVLILTTIAFITESAAIGYNIENLLDWKEDDLYGK